MSVLLFIDESGQDRQLSPYEVLAGVAIPDTELWGFVQQVKEAELDCFGCRYSADGRELKGKKLLKRKTFRLAGQEHMLNDDDRRILATECLETPQRAGRLHLAALAQAKLAFVGRVLELAHQYGFKAFASIVSQDSPRPDHDVLRKDYSYLFQRFCYFLEDNHRDEMGIVVFDELEKSQSHVLLNQMDRYFLDTATGRARATRIIPEPFFVHSDLTTGIQIADLIAYITSWGIRFGNEMDKPARAELSRYTQQVLALRHRSMRPAELFGLEFQEDNDFGIWSFAWISDLRPRNERR